MCFKKYKHGTKSCYSVPKFINEFIEKDIFFSFLFPFPCVCFPAECARKGILQFDFIFVLKKHKGFMYGACKRVHVDKA